MTVFWGGVLVGVVLGASFAVLLLGLCACAGRGSDERG